jgi:predicted metal-dependent phosphotriesterase family hydrolase
MPDAAATLDWAQAWGVDDAGLKQILVDNPRRLFWGS